MASEQNTCWTLIHAAADGHESSRDLFARLYQPVAVNYFSGRWNGSLFARQIDDAIQDVFVECFKAGGVLDRVVNSHPDGFRRFFHGVLRNVARRYEAKRLGQPRPEQEEPIADMTSASRAFDRAWAELILKEAARIQAENAQLTGERALRRVELLRLRFNDNLPIRDIATLWAEDPVKLHHEFATARTEFSAALRQAIAFQNPQSPPDQIESNYRDLLILMTETG